MHTGNTNSDHPSGHQDRRPVALLVFALLILCVAAWRGSDFFPSPPSSPTSSPRLVWLEGAVPPGLYRLEPGDTLAGISRQAGLALPPGTGENALLPPPIHGPVAALRLAAGQPPQQLPRLPPHLAPLFFQPIPINQADAEVLAFLPGIGPKLAARIIESRRERGGFATLAEIDAVKGIGPAKLKMLAEQVVVE